MELEPTSLEGVGIVVDFSRVQFSNDGGQNFLDEVEQIELTLEASAFGFIKALTMVLGNAF